VAKYPDSTKASLEPASPWALAKDALDIACGLHLNYPIAWVRHPTNLRARPLSRSERVGL
jgi:hypothetical protein